MCTDLDQASFVTLTIDASNRKELKIVPVMVRYFVSNLGVKVKLLEFKSLPSETSGILSQYLLDVAKKVSVGG